MFKCNHYVPILKGKQGELRALGKINPSIRKKFTPFIDVPRIGLAYPPGSPNGVPKETIDLHLNRVAAGISKNWGTSGKVFVDLFDIDQEERTPSGDHPIKHLFSRLAELGVKAIPTTGTDRDKHYNKAVSKVLKLTSDEVCIRLLRDDLEVNSRLSDQLEGLLSDLGAVRENAHLLLDFRDLKSDDVATCVAIAKRTINSLPSIRRWKTLTVSASGFPETMGGIPSREISFIPRTEFQLWKALVKGAASLERLPSYGDYGIVHPTLGEFDPRKQPMAGKIRYTLPEKWLIVKGHSLRVAPKFGQYFGLAAQLIKRPEFLGAEYSWAGKRVSETASMQATSGNPMTWVQVDTVHHVTLVAKQISSALDS